MFCKKVAGIAIDEQSIQTDDYFKKLSMNYYGTTNYYKELSLVNNSLNNFSEDELIIPSREAIDRLQNNQNFTVTNFDLLNSNAATAAKEIYSPPNNVEKESFLPLVLISCCMSILITIVSINSYNKKRQIN